MLESTTAMMAEAAKRLTAIEALSLRYGGPDGSDWPKLLAWFRACIENGLSPDVRANREPETKVVFGP